LTAIGGTDWQKNLGQKMSKKTRVGAIQSVFAIEPLYLYFFAPHFFGAPGEAWLILLAERS
jgi:hypothetical protein